MLDYAAHTPALCRREESSYRSLVAHPGKTEFMPRNYVKKGGNGGARPGAGRPEGVNEPLPRGTIAALKGLRHRVPSGTPEVAADIADEAFSAIVDVMRGEFRRKGSREVLRAATALRAEVCGPIVQKLEHTGADGQALIVEVRTYGADEDGAEEPARGVVGLAAEAPGDLGSNTPGGEGVWNGEQPEDE